MISNFRRGTRIDFTGMQCAQCAGSASFKMPAFELCCNVDGEHVSFYVHADCLDSLSYTVLADHRSAVRSLEAQQELDAR